MKKMLFTLPLLIFLITPFFGMSQADKVTVENLSYDYHPDTGVFKNFTFDIVYNGETVIKGFTVYINLFSEDWNSGAIAVGSGQGFGGTGGGSDRRTISFDNSVDINNNDEIYNGTYRIAIYIPEYRQLVYEFSESEDKYIEYRNGEDRPTSIDRKNLTYDQIKIGPNPIVNGRPLNVYNTSDKDLEEIWISNQQGQVLEKNLQVAEGKKIRTNHLAPGVYYIHFQGKDDLFMEKVLITN